MNNIKVKAFFLDRDDVLIVDKDYLHKVSEVEFIPGIFETLKYLQSKDFLLIGVSNQSGIGRGKFPESDCVEVNEFIIKKFKEEGIDLKEIFYCPHGPDDECKCRKPETEMFEKAGIKYNINFQESYMLGDKLSDIEAGIRMGCKTILFDKLPEVVETFEKPDYVIESMVEVIDIVAKN